MPRYSKLVILVLGIAWILAACSQQSGPELDSLSAREDFRAIVILNERPDVAQADQNRAVAASVARAYGLSPSHTYGAAVIGFAAVIPEGRLSALQRDPRVKYIEEDGRVEIYAQETPTGVSRVFATGNGNLDIDGTDDFRVDVDVAVIDTGVDFEHPDLNVVGGVNCSGGGPFRGTCSTGGDDDHYHGTHVAGTIGAIDNGSGVVGVAPGARIWAVKVLDSSGRGYESWIVAGIDWVAQNADVIDVANMSLGGSGFSQAEYDAIQGAVDKGVAFAVAAGNSDADANDFSPAAFDNVLTVSALADFDGKAGGLVDGASGYCRADGDDTLADFSNWGSAVQIAAPGVCILSTYPIEQGEYGTISGTSMASPHAAGALALLASNGRDVNGDGAVNAMDILATNEANGFDGLYAQVMVAGNFSWTDDSGDGITEPLLDLSDTTLFAPMLVSTGSEPVADGPPTVTVTSPVDGDSFDSGASISFSGSASDDEDGDVTSNLTWSSDIDGAIGTGGSFSVTLSDGSHVITAGVTDSAGNTSSESVTVTVGSTDTVTEITLSANPYKVRGVHHVDLSWSGASSSVVVSRNGGYLTTVSGTTYTDNTGNKGGATYIYQVCNGGTTTCSNEVTVTF